MEMAVHVQAVDICFLLSNSLGTRVILTTPFHSKVVVKDARKSVIKSQLISDQKRKHWTWEEEIRQ